MDLHRAALCNDDFKRVVQTTARSQATVMTLLPGTDIGDEAHAGFDQLVAVVAGNGVVAVDGVRMPVGAGSTVLVPGGARHNVVNTHVVADLRLIVVYTPPKYPPDAIYPSREG